MTELLDVASFLPDLWPVLLHGSLDREPSVIIFFAAV
jgi:hypothetical protein